MSRKDQDLCSVIMTCYQREKYIEKSVMSVFNQSYRPIECIVINDGSTDKSLDILKKLEKLFLDKNDFELKVVSTENKGACAARNLGFSLSNGVYIQNFDSDDILHPIKLELQVKALILNPDCDSAWNPLDRFEDHEEDNIIQEIKTTFEVKQSEENPFIPQFMPSAGLHRREVFEKAGLWTETLKRWQDFEYQVRIMSNVKKYVQFDDAMYFFRQHNSGRINDLFKSTQGVKAGFVSMQSLEYYLLPNHKSLEIVRKTLRDSYASLFKTAISNNLVSESILALNYGLDWSSSLNYKVKMNILIYLIKFMPLSITKLILKLGKFL